MFNKFFKGIMKRYLKFIALFSIGFIIISCQEKDDDKIDDIDLPTTYSFDNVDYSGQTERLNQATEIINLVKTANTGAKLDENVLLDMYKNVNGNGNGNFTFSSTKQLFDKTSPESQDLLISYFKELANVSGTTEVAESGKAGIIATGTRSVLVNANGQEYKELIEKGLMAAVFLHQISNVYLSPDKMNVDNITNVEGKNYTTMEHHWDEAFGYLGATTLWPTDATDQRFWAKYSRKSGADITNGKIDTPSDITKAFIKGRDAIKRKDYTERDKQITEVNKQLELIVATTAISYLNGTITNFGDAAMRSHQLSEAYGCIWGLNYINYLQRTISKTEIDTLLEMLGTNFFEITNDKLISTRNKLAEIYGLTDIKENF